MSARSTPPLGGIELDAHLPLDTKTHSAAGDFAQDEFCIENGFVLF